MWCEGEKRGLWRKPEARVKSWRFAQKQNQASTTSPPCDLGQAFPLAQSLLPCTSISQAGKRNLHPQRIRSGGFLRNLGFLLPEGASGLLQKRKQIWTLEWSVSVLFILLRLFGASFIRCGSVGVTWPLALVTSTALKGSSSQGTPDF